MNTTFEKARAFMYRNARPLDLARFQYHFENGSKEAVLNILSYYQNEDGGFGHAVEADCWNPNSIPLHSNTASEIIREIDVMDSQQPVIQGLLKWYESGKHFNGKSWEITVESNNDYPHAPWWHTESVSSCHTDYNGTAQIAGFIARYADKGSDIFKLGVRIANEAIEALSPDEIRDMHTCVCYMRMAELFEKGKATEHIPFDELKEKLHISINKLIVTDTSKWSGYVCQPSCFINSKESEYYLANKEIADYECKHIINTQLADGSWNIGWTWGGNYPDEWAISKNWWKGQWIIQNLLYLKGFELL
ncbi:hypothetical protein [Methanobrevibacter sp.]|uniref:hypothetical protein n=1 Tax=Methanobrevibacter sp. TaxID=66852 RepID=UPI00388E46BC